MKVAKGTVDIAKQGAGEALGKMASSVGNRTEERLFNGKPRGRLLTLLSEMPDEDTKNLWRHHREALEDDDSTAEDRFIYNLTKLLGEGSGTDERCKAVFKWLNGLEDDQFEQAVELLKHDAVAQVMQKIKLHGWKTAKDILVKAAEAASDKVGDASREVKNSLPTADKKAGQDIRKFHRWLEKVGVVSDGPRYSKKGV